MGVTSGGLSAANTPPAGGPGGKAAFVVLLVLSGAGVEKEAGVTITDWPAALMNAVLLVFQVSLLPPANSPTPPSTRSRTNGVPEAAV